LAGTMELHVVFFYLCVAVAANPSSISRSASSCLAEAKTSASSRAPSSIRQAASGWTCIRAETLGSCTCMTRGWQANGEKGEPAVCPDKGFKNEHEPPEALQAGGCVARLHFATPLSSVSPAQQIREQMAQSVLLQWRGYPQFQASIKSDELVAIGMGHGASVTLRIPD
jgi:hypothetical protein